MEDVSLEEGKLQLLLNPPQLDLGLPVMSELVTIQSLPWRLMVTSPDVVHSSQGGKGKTLGVFLQCVPSLPGSRNWTALAHVVVKMTNHNNAEKSLIKTFDHKYSSSSTDWGYSTFMKCKDLSDLSKGFIKDGKIILEANIQVQSNNGANGAQYPMASGDVDNFLVCDACGDGYEVDGDRQPMSLRCGHTFCLVCLKKTVCKSEDKVCIECSSCNKLHTSSKNGNETELWFPNHSIVQIIKNAISKSKYYCRVHQQEKNYYCFNDNILVCIYCAFHGEHSTHKCKHLEDAQKEAHKELKSIKLSVSTHVSEIKRHLQFVKDEKELLKCQEANICGMIEESYEQLKAALQRQKELMFEEVKSQTSELSMNVDANTLKLEEKHSQVKDILNKYTSWQSLPVKDALEAYSSIQSQLSSIKSLCNNKATPQILEPCPKVYFEMCAPSEVLSCTRLGKIVVGKENPVRTGCNIGFKFQEFGEQSPSKKKRKSCV